MLKLGKVEFAESQIPHPVVENSVRFTEYQNDPEHQSGTCLESCCCSGFSLHDLFMLLTVLMRRCFCAIRIIQEGPGWHSSSLTASGQCSCKEFHAHLCPGAELCVDVHHIYCNRDLHSLTARVWKHASQNIWKMSTCASSWESFGLLLHVHILFWILYHFDRSKIMQFVSGGILFLESGKTQKI